MFNGERVDMKVSKLTAYAKACGVRAAWLILGDGPMLDDGAARTVERETRYSDVLEVAAAVFRHKPGRFAPTTVERAISQARAMSHDEHDMRSAGLDAIVDHLREIATAIQFDDDHPELAKQRAAADALRARRTEDETRPNFSKRRKR